MINNRICIPKRQRSAPVSLAHSLSGKGRTAAFESSVHRSVYEWIRTQYEYNRRRHLVGSRNIMSCNFFGLKCFLAEFTLACPKIKSIRLKAGRECTEDNGRFSAKLQTCSEQKPQYNRHQPASSRKYVRHTPEPLCGCVCECLTCCLGCPEHHGCVGVQCKLSRVGFAVPVARFRLWGLIVTSAGELQAV